MLKKLQSLLFEEEDDLDKVEEKPAAPAVKEPETPKPAEVKPPVVEDARPAEKVELPKPAVKEERTTMQRIDVTQPMPTIQDSPKPKPRTESVFREQKAEEPKPSIGIKADDSPAPKKRPQKNIRPAKPERPERKRTQDEDRKPSYIFNPVISPIFGVDEKDLQALTTTTTKTMSKEKKDKKSGFVSPVISPMYGTDADNSPPLIQDNVQSGNILESMTLTSEVTEAEDEIPEFSLDDILKVRDEEFAEEYGSLDSSEEDDVPIFPDLTFPDEPESDEEETVVITKPDLGVFSDDE